LNPLEAAFCYSAFGLTIGSDAELASLTPIDPVQPDIQVLASDVPFYDDDENLMLREGLPPELVVNFESLVRLGITRDRVHYQGLGQSLANDVRHTVSDCALGLLLLLRGTPPLHAAAVHVGALDGAAILCGSSGAGKSTLSLALANHGYPKMADDIAAISLRGALAYVEPGVAHSKLLVDALNRLSVPAEGLHQVAHRMDKYIVPLTLWPRPEPLRCVVEIDLQSTGPVVLKELRGVEKLGTLDRHTIGTLVMRRFGLRNMHMGWLVKLAARTKVYRLTRPADRDTIHEIISALERLWSDLGIGIAAARR
jgi:hypothetical protein